MFLFCSLVEVEFVTPEVICIFLAMEVLVAAEVIVLLFLVAVGFVDD